MNLQALRQHQIPSQRVTYGAKDAILYALSLGAGIDPLDAHQLRLVYEKNLAVLPTFAAVLAHPGGWMTHPSLEVNYAKLLHGEQTLTLHRPIPSHGTVDATYQVTAVVDKGEGKGALLFFDKLLSDTQTGERMCTVTSALFLRGDGGCGSFGTPPPALPEYPAGSIEFVDELKTAANAALLYRLNGDLNPIHADPAAAAQAGFDRPLLHGLCTYGVVGYLLTRTVCEHDPARLRFLGARFSSPVFPGETIRIEGRRTNQGVHFRALVPERSAVVLTHGFAQVGPAS